MAAPDGSTTVPVIEPVCACSKGAERKKTKERVNASFRNNDRLRSAFARLSARFKVVGTSRPLENTDFRITASKKRDLYQSRPFSIGPHACGRRMVSLSFGVLYYRDQGCQGQNQYILEMTTTEFSSVPEYAEAKQTKAVMRSSAAL
jgi:hypothetical protein